MMVTIIIIAITVAVSLICFYGRGFDALKFNAYDVWHRKQWYRMFSYGFVHGGWGHLFFNMLTLYFFGNVVEQYFAAAFGDTTGIILYVVLYTTAILVSTIGDLVKYRNDINYNAVGASGAVSAILFASILFEPKMGIYIYLIPIPVPGFVFAPLYLLYCWYMAKRNADNIGHSAHFWGAVYGLLFPLLCNPAIFNHFINQLHK
ncbi:MAG: rhomboid family intramembrane serine protease [Bacteroidales bacterium]|nr:rhomboid family intramembrane serine protease [Bacteroidales bacterium]